MKFFLLNDNYQEVGITQYYCSYHPLSSFDVWLHWNRCNTLPHTYCWMKLSIADKYKYIHFTLVTNLGYGLIDKECYFYDTHGVLLDVDITAMCTLNDCTFLLRMMLDYYHCWLLVDSLSSAFFVATTLPYLPLNLAFFSKSLCFKLCHEETWCIIVLMCYSE